MSRFFKALEQADQERALRQQAAPAASSTAPTGPGIETAPQPELRPALELSVGTSDGVEEHLVSLLTPASFEAEQYRALRHLVEQLHKSADLSVVAVSSPSPGDGKTTTAANLAGTLAQASEARVLLVDADLRDPSLAKHLGLHHPSDRGLVDAILDSSLSLEAVVQRVPPFNLSVLPAGQLPSAPYEVLKSPRVGELLEEARRRYDYILIDTPPLVSLPDCRVIGKWVDGFLVVVAAHKTPRKLVEEALSLLDPAKIAGIVFNSDERPLSGYYSYGYYSPSFNGNGVRRWGRAVKKAGGSIRGRLGRFRKGPRSAG